MEIFNILKELSIEIIMFQNHIHICKYITGINCFHLEKIAVGNNKL